MSEGLRVQECQVLSARLLGDNRFAEAHATLIEIGGTPRLPFLSRSGAG